jgi:hypothetical protein
MSPIGCLREPDALFLKIPLQMPLASDVPWSMLGQITKKTLIQKKRSAFPRIAFFMLTRHKILFSHHYEY